jgi:type II secretory pathway pseudopilin PulG
MRTFAENSQAFTRLELIVTLTALALVAAIVLPPMLSNTLRASKLQRCRDNLRQIGQGWIEFATPEQRWPWEVRVEQGGTRNLTNAGAHFLVLSNVAKPSITVCPADPGIRPVADWNEAREMASAQPPRRSTSYFVGIDATLRTPTLLSGDHDLGGITPNVGCRHFQKPVTAAVTREHARSGMLQWTNRLHKRGEGNILLSDGSIRSGTAKILNEPLLHNREGDSSFSNHHILPPVLP